MPHPASSCAVARRHQGFPLLPRVAMEHHARLGKAAGGYSLLPSLSYAIACLHFPTGVCRAAYWGAENCTT